MEPIWMAGTGVGIRGGPVNKPNWRLTGTLFCPSTAEADDVVAAAEGA